MTSLPAHYIDKLVIVSYRENQADSRFNQPRNSSSHLNVQSEWSYALAKIIDKNLFVTIT